MTTTTAEQLLTPTQLRNGMRLGRTHRTLDALTRDDLAPRVAAFGDVDPGFPIEELAALMRDGRAILPVDPEGAGWALLLDADGDVRCLDEWVTRVEHGHTQPAAPATRQHGDVLDFGMHHPEHA